MVRRWLAVTDVMNGFLFHVYVTMGILLQTETVSGFVIITIMCCVSNYIIQDESLSSSNQCNSFVPEWGGRAAHYVSNWASQH